MKSNSSNNTPFSRNPLPEVKSVGEISFNELKIPPYQRPYKWTSKNVNQLITDYYIQKQETIQTWNFSTLQK